MTDLLLARPWNAVSQELNAEGIVYELCETRSPRTFFLVDPAEPYVIRVRWHGDDCVVTYTPAPARSDTVAAYEEALR